MKTLWDEDGFMYTGDYGYYNEEQCFFVLDRIKSLVKYKGWHVRIVTRNIYTLEYVE